MIDVGWLRGRLKAVRAVAVAIDEVGLRSVARILATTTVAPSIYA